MNLWHEFLRAIGVMGRETDPVVRTAPKPVSIGGYQPIGDGSSAPLTVPRMPSSVQPQAIPVHAVGETTSPVVSKRDRFPECMPLIRKSEGGYVDDPLDPGGATNLGITIGTLSAWRGRPVTKAEVKALTQAEADAIYRANYWANVRGDDLPVGVDQMMLDCAVNQGVSRASRFLQQAAGVSQDGVIGNVTLAAVRRSAPHLMVQRLANLREMHYRSLPTWPRFGNGWLNRLNEVEAKALADCADKA